MNKIDLIGKQVYCHNTWWTYEKIVIVNNVECAKLVDKNGSPIYISVNLQDCFIEKAMWLNEDKRIQIKEFTEVKE